MKQDVENLKGMAIFKNFSETMLEEFAEFFKQTEYSEKEIIFKERSEGDTLFIIVFGEVVIEKRVEKEEHDFIPLAILGKGEFFGEMAVLEGQVRFAQARASKETMLYAIKRNEFFNFIKKHPDAGISIFTEIMKVILRRLQHTSNELTMLFDMSKLIMGEHKSAATFIAKTVEEISPHLDGSWNINGYMFNRFDGIYDLVISKETFIEDINRKGLKAEDLKNGWLDGNSYLLTFAAYNKVLGYIMLAKSVELSSHEKNNLSTMFGTISSILGPMIANINYWTEAMIKAIEKGLSSPHGS
ncbi:MAG: cyclic nucleotide-binding domain-containing protein [Elusimicrobia bacterium]|nr:cyclic nucleotide-binding domain-containing protein [Elusimicrobiota bacterium]